MTLKDRQRLAVISNGPDSPKTINDTQRPVTTIWQPCFSSEAQKIGSRRSQVYLDVAFIHLIHLTQMVNSIQEAHIFYRTHEFMAPAEGLQ